MRFLIFIFCSIFFLFFSSCKKSYSVEPEELKPGRRDYTWKIDTLPPSPFNVITKMWGDAENNIWGIAAGLERDKVLWKFDGSGWKNFPLIPLFLPSSIYGFGTKNIWAESYGMFWHYDGKTWTMQQELQVNNSSVLGIENICGKDPNNLYGVGVAFADSGNDYRPLIVHYDGNKWSKIEIKGNNSRLRLFNICKDSRSSQLYFINGFLEEPGRPCIFKIFTFDGITLKEIYPCSAAENEPAFVSEMDNQAHIIIGQKIFKYENNQLVLWKNFTGTIFYGMIWGRNEKDFFFNTRMNNVGHYNGSDLITIYPNFYIYNAVILDNKVTFQFYDNDNSTNLILTGKLQNR